MKRGKSKYKSYNFCDIGNVFKYQCVCDTFIIYIELPDYI